MDKLDELIKEAERKAKIEAFGDDWQDISTDPKDGTAIMTDKQWVEWLYGRIDHLLFAYDNPDTVPGMYGPSETMTNVRDNIQFLRNQYGFKPTWVKEPLPQPPQQRKESGE